jgi:hypothetical protein
LKRKSYYFFPIHRRRSSSGTKVKKEEKFFIRHKSQKEKTMELSSLSSIPAPSPAIHLMVTRGGREHEAMLVDPSVLYLLKKKKEEGMYSASLGDLLAPRLGVKILWISTNRTELVEASSIRLIQKCNWQRNVQVSIHQSMRMEEALVNDRRRLISTLRASSSLASEAIRKQFLPQSLGVISSHAGEHTWNNNDGSNKRRKLCNNYSSWLQQRSQLISPDITAVLENTRNDQITSERSNKKLGPYTSSFSTRNNLSSDENVFLEHMLSAKHTSQWSGVASRAQAAKKAETTEAASKDTTTTNTNTGSTGHSWEHMFGRLRKHMEERGIDKVPTRIHIDPELRTWVSQQRLDFKKRNLTNEHEFLLRSVGFHRDKFTLKWDAKFERLQEFKKECGHTNVPFHYANDRQLGTWVSKQRVRIRQGTISEEERVRLEAIGFVPNRFNARWEEMFRRLVAYKKIYGDANVPRVYEKDPQLAQWVLNQKDAFREGKMKPERQIKLEAIGFSWSTFYEGDLEWERNFRKLIAQKSLHEHVQSFKDPKLVRWVALQQSLQSMGIMNQQRMELLVSIGVISPPIAASASNAMTNAMSSATARNILMTGMLPTPVADSASSNASKYAMSSAAARSIAIASSGGVPPMTLRRSFSDWNPTGKTDTFI